MPSKKNEINSEKNTTVVSVYMWAEKYQLDNKERMKE